MIPGALLDGEELYAMLQLDGLQIYLHMTHISRILSKDYTCFFGNRYT